MSYRIVRRYQRDNEPNEIIRRGLTLKEAQAHCSDKETSSKTCTHRTGLERTAKHGEWFDSYDEEPGEDEEE